MSLCDKAIEIKKEQRTQSQEKGEAEIISAPENASSDKLNSNPGT